MLDVMMLCFQHFISRFKIHFMSNNVLRLKEEFQVKRRPKCQVTLQFSQLSLKNPHPIYHFLQHIHPFYESLNPLTSLVSSQLVAPKWVSHYLLVYGSWLSLTSFHDLSVLVSGSHKSPIMYKSCVGWAALRIDMPKFFLLQVTSYSPTKDAPCRFPKWMIPRSKN